MNTGAVWRDNPSSASTNGQPHSDAAGEEFEGIREYFPEIEIVELGFDTVDEIDEGRIAVTFPPAISIPLYHP